MMKIGEMAGQAPDLPDPKRKVRDREKVGGPKGAPSSSRVASAPAFAQAFFDASKTLHTRALDQIMDELGRQGERLAASQNFEELGRYKALVQEFLKKAVQGVARLRLTDGNSQGRSGKVHVILEKVDSGLESLTQAVLSKQATPLALLGKLDQIRGLLLDLYK